MARISYTVRRHVEARKENGDKAMIAIALIVRENGTKQTVCIDEEFIRYAGEGAIEDEVKQAAAMPSDASLGNPLGL